MAKTTPIHEFMLYDMKSKPEYEANIVAAEILMVDVQQTNEKLHTRAENIVIDATGVEREKARAAIDAAGGSVKTAITMLLADCDAAEAARRLEKARGHVREAIRLEVL